MRLILFVLLFLFVNCFVYAEESQSITPQSPTTYQNIPYENCSKLYDVDKTALYYLAIGAVNANKFTIDELQTNNGYIIFSTGKNKYLITVAGVDNANSIIKITPCNNLYYFQPGIISNIYKYIDLNKDAIRQ